MADEPSTPVASPADEAPSFAIVRDPTFVRLVADMAFVIDRNSDFELSLIAFGPDPVSHGRTEAQDGDRSAHRLQMAASYNEVARLRMDFGPAMNLAMNIIENNLAAGRVNVAAFRAALDALLAQASPKGEAVEDEVGEQTS